VGADERPKKRWFEYRNREGKRKLRRGRSGAYLKERARSVIM